MSLQQTCGLQKVGRRDFHEMLETVVGRVMAEKGQLIVFAHHHSVMDQLYILLGKIGVDRCAQRVSLHCYRLQSQKHKLG